MAYGSVRRRGRGPSEHPSRRSRVDDAASPWPAMTSMQPDRVREVEQRGASRAKRDAVDRGEEASKQKAAEQSASEPGGLKQKASKQKASEQGGSEQGGSEQGDSEGMVTDNEGANPSATPANQRKRDPYRWPHALRPIFAISIREERWAALRTRMDGWSKLLTLWPGTDGHRIDKGTWIREGLTVPRPQLTRGELGCHDSHVRLWEHMTAKGIPSALILEDDADIRYRKRTVKRVREGLSALKTHGLQWDLLYIGHGSRSHSGEVAPGIVRPRDCYGLFAYVLTLRGAAILLDKARPYRLPVDVLVAELSDNDQLRAVALWPSLCYVVPVRSDTAGIK